MPFMKRRTGLVSTRDWMRDWVGSSEDWKREVGVRGMGVGMVGAVKAVVGVAREAARRRMERIMM